jgi:hypothetical protein
MSTLVDLDLDLTPDRSDTTPAERGRRWQARLLVAGGVL